MYIVKEAVNKTMQVWVLDIETKNEIKALLEKELSEIFSGNELDEYVECGMDGRLCDLEETIDLGALETIHIL